MLNRVVLIGRLTKDPELRYSSSGTAVATFTLAVDRAFQKDETDFIPIVVWKKAAENCAEYLRKGRLTAVEGRIQTRNYEGKDGKRQYVTEVVADNVRFLERGEQQEKPQNLDRNDPFYDEGKLIDISPDDLPF